MRAWLRSRAKPRDSFFFLIFTVLFLWGLIPAFWGDRAQPQAPQPPLPPEPPPTATTTKPERTSEMRLCVAW
jgi:hypothetical protein